MSDRDTLDRLPCLDGLRAVAALMVMVFHFIDLHRGIPALVQASSIGQTGVDLFFVLSGFLITRILLSSKHAPHYFQTFYARRTLRIFPLYFGYLALYFLLLPWFLGDPIPPFSAQAWSWFYLENLPQTFPGLHSAGPGHFWSLAVEEHFYLLWPLLVYLLSRRRFGVAVVVTLVIPPILRAVFLAQGLPVFFFTFTRMDALGYGAALALMLTAAPSPGAGQVRLFRTLIWLLPALLIPSFVFLSGARFAWLQIVKLSLIPAYYFALIGFCLTDPAARHLTRWLSARWLRWLGAISYGLYVFHPTCFTLVHRLPIASSVPAAAALSFGATIAAAYLSFRFYESPILRLKKRFPYESEPPKPSGAAPKLRAA
jgi:peptidoglycan/LPS O-acetylase OafA/YrhL